MDNQGCPGRVLLVADVCPACLKPDAIKDRTIADGINQKLIAYAGKIPSGQYAPLFSSRTLELTRATSKYRRRWSSSERKM